MKIKYILFLLFLVLLISPVYTQTKSKSMDTSHIRTREVIVTGMRYPENLLEIPLSVSLINQEKLMNIRGYGFDEVLNAIPGLLVQSRSGNHDVRFTIRGFGARGAGDRSNAGTSRGIKILLDNIPETEPDGRTAFDNIDLSMAQNIEIIRSNASAIWGNAAGGVVNVSTIPSMKDKYLGFTGMGGSFGFQKYLVQTGSNVGLGKVFSSFSVTKSDGWRENSDAERYMLNIGIQSYMTPQTLLGVYIVGVSNKFNIPGPLTQIQFDTMPNQANPTYLQRKEFRYNRSGRIGITLDHQFDDDNSVSSMCFVNPKFLQRSERGTYRDFTRYHVGANTSYRNKIDFSSDLKNILLIGMDEAYQDGAILFYGLTSNAERDTLRTNKWEGAITFGVFAQDEFLINDKLTFLVGARYDAVTYFNQIFNDAGIKYPDFKEKKTFSHITPKAGFSYRLDERHSVFANLGGGVEVPAGNETDPANTFGQDSVYLINPMLDPIVSTTIEVGSKNIEYFNGGFFKSLSYEAAVYMIDVTNDIIPYSGGKFYFTAGKTQRIGVELGFKGEFDYGLSCGFAFTYSNNKYVDYKVDSVHYNKPGTFADYKDNKIAGMPGMYYSGNLRYTSEAMKNLYLEVSAQGIGNYFVDDANKYDVPSYTVINATIGFGKAVELVSGIGLRAFMSVNNIADTKYAASAFINPDIEKSSKLPIYLEPGLPRNFVLGLTIEWK